MSNAIAEKRVLVIGGTGQQGGSVIKGLVAGSPSTKIRVPTRNPDSDSAKKLVASSEDNMIECVKADLDDAASMEAAMRDCEGVYLVTNFWQEGMNAAKEFQQSKMVLEIAKNTGVQHLVFSCLHDSRTFEEMASDETNEKLEGDYLVPHYDGKGDAANQLFHTQADVPVSLVYCPFYMDNFFGMMAPNDGVFLANFGDKKQSMITVEDIGKAMAAVFVKGPADAAARAENGDKWPEYILSADQVTYAEAADLWTKIMAPPEGKEGKYVDPGQSGFVEAMVGFGVPELVAKEICQMYKLQQTEAYIAQFNPKTLKELVPDAKTLADFLTAKKAAEQ